MTVQLDDTGKAGREALETLRQMLFDEEITDSARVSAAKALLDRYSPLDDDERKRRESEERNAALIEARGLLIELAVAKSASLLGADEVAEAGTSEPTDA